MSHPVWVCGLKLKSLSILIPASLVTPCMGVWIETSNRMAKKEKKWSHPVWVCGLKLICKRRCSNT